MKAPIKPRVLVTGATGGIGAPLCRHLASAGYSLILAARNRDRIQSLVDELRATGNPAEGVSIDFGNPNSFESLVPFMSEGLDGLVLMPPQLDPTTECLPSDETWQRAFQRSFIGPVALIRQALPRLKMRTRSKVVVVSGISSAQVLSHYATSNVLRTAWLAQAKTLAFVYGPDGVHFNTLSLGGVMTDEYEAEVRAEEKQGHATYDQLMAAQVHNVPLRKYAAPSEVAFAIEGLLSRFSDHMTGVNILCDGGFTRAY